MGPLNWRPILMPLNLIKRSERITTISSAEHDANMTAIEGAMNSLETQLAALQATVTSLGSTVGKIENIVEDTTPELGGDLNGNAKTAHNLRSQIVSKTGSFTADPGEAAVYNIQSTTDIVLTLPSSLDVVPPGTGFEIHIERNIGVTLTTESENSDHIVNFDTHRKLRGPLGTAFLRVLGPDGIDAVWKVFGNTAPMVVTPPPDPDDPDPPVTPDAAAWLANPFIGTSPHHRPIGTGAEYSSTALHLARFTGVNLNVDNGGGTNVYLIAPTDPVKTIAYDGSNPGGGTGAQLPFSLRVPQNIVINGNVTDRVIMLYDPTTYICHQFWHWGESNVNPTAGRRISWDIRGSGLNAGSSASKVGCLFGLVRGAEITTAGKAIQHVLHIAANRFDDTSVLSKEFVWPSYGRDSSWADPARNLGNIPYGALIAVPPPNKGGPTKASLALSEMGGRLYDCVVNFGIYVIDGTSSTNMVFRADQLGGWTQAYKDEFRDQMNKFRPHLRRVINNFENQTASGGGTRLASNNPLG